MNYLIERLELGIECSLEKEFAELRNNQTLLLNLKHKNASIY